MSVFEKLCSCCQKKFRDSLPSGGTITIYVPKRSRVNKRRLLKLLRNQVPTRNIATQFGLTQRRVQQIAATV